MQIALAERGRRDGVATLSATLAPQSSAVSIRYKTWTGALLRVDGVAAGAFDREHHEVVLPPSDNPRELALDVELHALPTNGLPSGPGLIWWFLNVRAHQKPARHVEVTQRHGEVSLRHGEVSLRHGEVSNHPEVSKGLSRSLVDPSIPQGGSIPHHDVIHHDKGKKGIMLLGHSHLDVAWLWTYEQTRRKAQRTFAIACDLLDRDPGFVFIQSQPQLYAFVEEADPRLFERVREHVASGCFDPDVAALWVESDCNVPSGESLLRQMLFALEYCETRFGTAPGIAWLPDTFGFANTLPQLLAHAGIRYFSTTKLQWNDTTKFPYPQFVWSGPDGSSVVAALIQSYDGGPYPWRVSRARDRKEPLVVGYGDGGGGVTSHMLEQAHNLGHWIHPRAWFDELSSGRGALPQHKDELYLEYHRGVYTTHHDVKFHNALLERALAEAEEQLAWCAAVHAPASSVTDLHRRLDAAWEIVLRNQFHDVIPGTSIEPVYEDAAAEYAQAEEITASVLSGARTMLPRATAMHEPPLVQPREIDGEYLFENALLSARVRANGTIVELAAGGSANTVTQANLLALYRDKPKQWEAWNVDSGYERTMRGAKPLKHAVENGALIVEFALGKSPATMCIRLKRGEPYVQVDLDVDWNERRTLLRVENWLPLQADRVTYGSPHGTIVRTARSDTPQARAKFEVPGQRFAAVRSGAGSGVALLALDTYGWSARLLPKGGIHLGHSLLRGTTWPDPAADVGRHRLSYAFAPLDSGSNASIERMWERFAFDRRVRLFVPENDNVIVAACKPAQDGDGVILRVRECDGSPAAARVRCGARMTELLAVDGLERPLQRDGIIEGETLTFSLKPYELRSFRVRFSHA